MSTPCDGRARVVAQRAVALAVMCEYGQRRGEPSVARVAWLVGAQVRREVTGLDPSSGQRPDLQIVFPGRMLLSDVSVSTSLTAGRVALNGSSAADWQTRKNKKYAGVASRLGAELLNLCLDACGGMASDAERLVAAIGEEGERFVSNVGIRGSVARQLRNC